MERFEAACGYPIERMHSTVLGSTQWKSPSAVLGRLLFVWDLYRVARRKRAEYIVANQSLAMAGCLAAKAARIPVVHIVHHVPRHMYPGFAGALA